MDDWAFACAELGYACDFLSACGILSVIYLRCFIGSNGMDA